MDYINQAKHNKACASELAQTGRYKDWAVTATFYSAIHYVEAGLEWMRRSHPNKNCPAGVSIHDVREAIVKSMFRNCYYQYRDLRIASQNARYLQDNVAGSASSYFTQAAVNEFITVNLQQVQNEVERVAKCSLS